MSDNNKKEKKALGEYKCMPILWKNGKKIPEGDTYKAHCNHYNFVKEDKANKCANDDQRCIWIDPSQYYLYQTPWTFSITRLKLKILPEKVDQEPPEKDKDDDKDDVDIDWTHPPKDWDPNKVHGDGPPKLISVNSA